MSENPYVRGNYKSLFAFWKDTKGGIVSREEMIEHAQSIGMTPSEATASVTVILSPRETSGRGDCRGSISAHGHLYFAQPMAKVDGENRKFRLEWRNAPLAKRTRQKKDVDVSVDLAEAIPVV